MKNPLLHPGDRKNPARRAVQWATGAACGLFLAGTLLLAGCATRHDITLNSGRKITNVSRPVLDESTGVYHFRDAAGQEHTVRAMRVRVIEPAERRNRQNDRGF